MKTTAKMIPRRQFIGDTSRVDAESRSVHRFLMHPPAVINKALLPLVVAHRGHRQGGEQIESAAPLRVRGRSASAVPLQLWPPPPR